MRRLVDADVPPAERTVRDYAAWEAEQDDDIEGWLGLIGDTDVRFDRTGPAEVWLVRTPVATPPQASSCGLRRRALWGIWGPRF